MVTSGQRGQSLSEFVVVMAALVVISLVLGYKMLGQPDGAVMKVQENVTQKIANDLN